jgi:hypothetical protein
MEQIAIMKLQEAERRADGDLNLAQAARPSTSPFPSANQYQANIMKKGFTTKKLAFYNSAKSDINEKPARYLSDTNGFFNIRQNRAGT